MARKILLADDSVTAQNMGRKILADAGYEVITVNNGSAALKKIIEIKPDLVILDVYMPGYSGLEVCQRLKETPDSSRIPVLLTVGKLEPFKPEEAQRVRAEAFIVKPFEASELLTTLSKLEDKVVPRSEPSKGGRFARAIASVEESGRGRVQPIDGGDESWKSRISFPNEKAEPEAKAEDDSAIYNPMNRDLRTVVASPAERVEEKKTTAKKEEEKQLPEMAVERGVDVAAVAPACVPQDVTPEEVAAIAAAAAQIQALQIQLEEEKASAENAAAAKVAETAQAPENKIEETAQAAVPSAQAEQAAETQDIPMTMAAAGGDASRWTAVPVALDAHEANLSLEQEMQKAYAGLIAEQSVGATEKPEAAASVEAPAVTVAAVEQETPVATSTHEIEKEATPAVTAEFRQPESSPQVEHSSADSFVTSEAVAVSDVVTAEPLAGPEHSAAAAEAAIAQAVPEPVASQSAELASAVSTPAIEGAPESVAAVEQKIHSAQSEPAIEAGRSFTSFAQSTQEAPTQEEHLEELHRVESVQEVESVKTTAAAWATWRQTRDGSEPREDAPKFSVMDAPQQESAMPAEASADSAAMAVAAGAERHMQEAAQPTSENPGDVASIVDSVLADLRPRLMAEISRKISEKK